MDSIQLLWKHARQYLSHIGGSIIFNVLSAMLSVFSLLMMIPFLQVLFYPEEQLISNNQIPNIPWVDQLHEKWIQVLMIHGQQKALVVLCLSLVLVFVLKNLTRYLAAYFLIPVRTGIMRDLRASIYEKLLSLDYIFLKKKRRGEIFTNFGNDVQEVEYGIINFIETGIKEPVTILITLASLIIMSPYLTLWVIFLLPISAWVIGKIGKQLKKDSAEAQHQLSILQIMVDEVLHGIRIIQSFDLSSSILKNFDHTNNTYRTLHTDMLKRKELASPLSEMLAILVVAVLLLIGGQAILTGKSSLSPEVFITYIVVFSQIISPAKAFSNAWYFIQKGSASLERIQALTTLENATNKHAGNAKLETFKQSIELKNVNFSFGSKQVLHDISFHISKGEKVAIIGPSGSGKTTLLNILASLYPIPVGNILVDGIDSKQLHLQSYRKLFALVTQDPILFHGSIYDNLKMAQPHAQERDIVKALKMAGAWDFAKQLPQGIYTEIEERGQSLSIGQQQRITLARAYLRNSPILLFDEITSAQDGITDQQIQHIIQSLGSDKTVITIAHKLSNIYQYDKIIFLESGKITGIGTHEELLHQHELYAQMVALESRSTQ